ncbi:MAG: hypothetical protein AAGF93_13145 [Cyanobacteria bacterium P01_H01_bin.105]
MGSYFIALKHFKVASFYRSAGLGVFAIATPLFTALPALAHHPLGGKTPSTFIECFLSRLGHPVILLALLSAVWALPLSPA